MLLTKIGIVISTMVSFIFSEPEALVGAKGKDLYGHYCAYCHGSNGEWPVIENFPPLNKSEWLFGSPERAIQVVLHGLKGPIQVRGYHYDFEMPAKANADLTDREIASILSYVRTSWSNKESLISEEQVKQQRLKSKDRVKPWLSSELLQLYPLPQIDPPLQELTAEVYELTADKSVNVTKSTRKLDLGQFGVLDVMLIHKAQLTSKFMVKWEANLVVEQAGKYTFILASNAKAKLKVGNQLTLNYDLKTGTNKESTTKINNYIAIEPLQETIYLDKGKVSLEVIFTNLDAKSWLNLFYIDPQGEVIELSKKDR